MMQTTFFVKECPTCGRKLQVRIEYLGREMMCNHCGGDFIADDISNKTQRASTNESMITRIDDLLKDESAPGKPR